jgi:hypothetical protein
MMTFLDLAVLLQVIGWNYDVFAVFLILMAVVGIKPETF